MQLSFRILENNEIDSIIPFVAIINEHKISDEVLKHRFKEMLAQQYKCIGIFNDKALIGCCGLWFMTRHYAGRSIEVDHVFIKEAFRKNGIGKQLFKWLYAYSKENQVETIELNTYVQNHPSHKFYYNEGFNILGYHFLKKI